MCKKHSPHSIDKCMRDIIKSLNKAKVETLGCCCGHGKYHPTIIAKMNGYLIYEIYSGKGIRRKKRFYRRDKEGYYYLPEVENGRNR